LRQHTSVVYHLARRSTILSLHVSSSDLRQDQSWEDEAASWAEKAAPADASRATKSSQISFASELPRNGGDEDLGGARSDDRDGHRGLYGARSVPELMLIGKGVRCPSFVGEWIRCTASHSALATAPTHDNNNDSNDNDNSGGGGKLQRRLGDGCSENCDATATVLPARNDAVDDDNRRNDHKNAQRQQDNRVFRGTSAERQGVQSWTCGDGVASRRRLTSSGRPGSKPVTWHSELGGNSVQDARPRRRDDDDNDDDSAERRRTSTEMLKDVPPPPPSPPPVRRQTSPGADVTRKARESATAAAVVLAQSRSSTAKRKATRVLGVMFAVFVVFWTPFFVLNLLSASCPACVRSADGTVWTVLVWLGWVSSLANPVIYTSFSPAFRAAFRRLLTCRGRKGVSPAKQRQRLWTDQLRCRHVSLSAT